MVIRAHVRFCVQDAYGRSSPVWRVWQGKKTSDVYFSQREVAGDSKGSLHESGSWQLGLTTQYVAQKGIPPTLSGRHAMRWKRPAELWPGVTRAVSWYFPTSDLQFFKGLEVDGTTILPAAPPTEAVEVTMFFVRQTESSFEDWPGKTKMGTQLLAEMLLLNGESVMLVSRRFVPDQLKLQWSAQAREREQQREQASELKDTPERRARFALVGIHDQDRSVYIWDGAVYQDLSA